MALLCLSCLTAAAIQADCGNTATSNTIDASTPLPVTNQPLFLLDEKGRVHRAGFDHRARKLVSPPDFLGNGGTQRSADGRYIAYVGSLKGDPRNRYFLYDTSSDRNSQVLIRPQWGFDVFSFSPDGKLLGTFAGDDSRNASRKGVGLYLIETASGFPRFLGLPPDSRISSVEAHAKLRWRADGKAILVEYWDSKLEEFYEVSLSTGKHSRVAGRHPAEKHGAKFFRDVTEIALADDLRPQSSMRTNQSVSPDAALHANIDDKHVLRVAVPGKPGRIVASGGYNECEGQAITILGWVEGHRYLVIANGNLYQVYNTSSGTTTPLFPGVEQPLTIFW